MCPVCLLMTAGISILSGLITTSGLSAVAIKKTVFQPSEKKLKPRVESAVQSKKLVHTQEFKTVAVSPHTISENAIGLD